MKVQNRRNLGDFNCLKNLGWGGKYNRLAWMLMCSRKCAGCVSEGQV